MALPEANSRLDGTFELDLPAGTASVRVVTTAPGHTLAISRAEVGESDATITIALDQEGGRLELERPASAAAEERWLPLIVLDGQALDLALLDVWSKTQDPDPSTATLLVVGGMPPGSYAYCDLGFEEAMAVVGGVALPAPTACREGFLAPGGSLRLGRP
jgi:hypothetical protein